MNRERLDLLKGVMIDATTWEVWETESNNGRGELIASLVEHKHQNPPVMGEGCRACHLMDEYTELFRWSDRSRY